ncbi:hypothetical protein [Marivita geojedonensis]|uniref:hypothetical protein n=1 Tax=Marivita geojedonensis TaxID=1123756 RepID=UPI000D4401B6|nr:hypothetical protein [Marivita geojedonensis]PRY73267.1 hypothetical protein CLV76_13119 [Marivita geojedonensis]
MQHEMVGNLQEGYHGQERDHFCSGPWCLAWGLVLETGHQIPTLDEALSLIGDTCLVVLNLQEFDLEGLKAVLAKQPKGNLLAYGVDPEVVDEVVDATGIAGYANISQTRLFETETPLQILETWSEVIGDELVLAHVKRVRHITPELLERAEQLGVKLSVSGYGKEDIALGDKGDQSAWLETLDSGAMVYWTTIPDQLLEVLWDK